MYRITLGAALLLLGCATQQKETMSAGEAFGAQPVKETRPEGPGEEPKVKSTGNKPPERWARQFTRPEQCEKAARAMQGDGGDRAWNHLKACAARRGFAPLKELLEFWQEDLRTRPDATVMLADVLAVRGGQLASDLPLIQARRLPLFNLTTALVQVESAREKKGKPELVVAEMGLSVEEYDISGPTKYQTSARASYNTSRYGSGSGSYSRTSGVTNTKTQNTFSETGQSVVVKLTKADPFLVAGQNFLFLARFDGAKQTDVTADDGTVSEEPSKVGLVSVVSYHDLTSEYSW
jgi:hypothetical protein